MEMISLENELKIILIGKRNHPRPFSLTEQKQWQHTLLWEEARTAETACLSQKERESVHRHLIRPSLQIQA